VIMALIEVTLIPEAKKWWRMYSTHALTLAGAIPPAWAALPPDWQAHAKWMLWGLAPLVAISGVIGRVVKQPEISGCSTPVEESSAEGSSQQ